MARLQGCLIYILLFGPLFCAECFVLESLGAAAIAALGYKLRCNFQECCTDEYVPYNLEMLKSDLEENLFGQPLAQKIVSILKGHREAMDKKDHNALAISLHGWPGTGKNYVASMITRALFKNPSTKYVKWYTASSFPQSIPLEVQKDNLFKEISKLVKSCGRAVIIFDEVNDLPVGLLDVIKPMLDFHTDLQGVNYKDAIFIFLSNLNGNEITQQFIDLKKPRDSLDFSDFEAIIRRGAYQEIGGLKDAKIIFSQLIDHYIPFLPLEHSHVERCIQVEFNSWGVYNVEQKYIDEAMSVISFGPKEYPMYANAGCKRIKNIVSYLIQENSIPHRTFKEPEKSIVDSIYSKINSYF